MRITRRQYLQGAGAAFAAGAVGVPAIRSAQAQTPLANLPTTMIWSTYDVGSTGYVEASAIADAFGKRYGTRVRLQPSGSAIGRVKPLTDGRASSGWLASELFFSVEGLYEYCAPDWGPQNLRTLLGRPSSFSVVATKVSGITEPKHMKGKRFAIARSNSSVNIKVEAILAFAQLKWEDVELVDFPSYGATLKALVEGRADCAGVAPTAATLRELEASPYGIGWVALDPGNKDGWALAQKAVPFIEPFQEGIGAGLTDANPVWMMGYRYPMVTVSAGANADEVYAMTKAVAESYDTYKDVNPVMVRWQAAKAGVPPMDAALHEGAIRYLTEVGIWKPEHQQWQDATLKRHTALQTAWKEMMATEAAQKAELPELQKLWDARRAETLKSL